MTQEKGKLQRETADRAWHLILSSSRLASVSLPVFCIPDREESTRTLVTKAEPSCKSLHVRAKTFSGNHSKKISCERSLMIKVVTEILTKREDCGFCHPIS